MRKLFTLVLSLSLFTAGAQNLPLTAGPAYSLTGPVYHQGNGEIRRSISSTYFGYSSGYRVLMLGSASTTYNMQTEGSVTLSFGYDPSNNTNGAFQGDGRELLFRNGAAFTTPNNADNSYYLNTLVMKDGKIGLGTPTPQAILQMTTGPSNNLLIDPNVGIFSNNVQWNGTAYQNINSSLGGSFLQLGTDGSFGIRKIPAGSGNQAAAYAIYGDINGNIGVGTSSPESKVQINTGNVTNIGLRKELGLYVSGGGYAGNVQQIGFGYGQDLLNVPASIGHIVTAASGNTKGALFFATRNVTTDNAPVERMRIDAEGNVGIGTTAPATRLDVQVDANRRFRVSDVSGTQPYDFVTGGTAITLSRPSDGAMANGIYTYSNTTKDNMAIGSRSDLVFLAGSSGIGYQTERMRILEDGNVGIGITTPSEKLSVNGNIKAKKIIVSQTGWADHVFNDDYQLKPLQEVASFIKMNKRLPEVPSAKEVAEKGVSLGDTQALLLKKVEELTLYLIKMQSQLDSANKKIKRLESSIKK